MFLPKFSRHDSVRQVGDGFSGAMLHACVGMLIADGRHGHAYASCDPKGCRSVAMAPSITRFTNLKKRSKPFSFS